MPEDVPAAGDLGGIRLRADQHEIVVHPAAFKEGGHQVRVSRSARPALDLARRGMPTWCSSTARPGRGEIPAEGHAREALPGDVQRFSC